MGRGRGAGAGIGERSSVISFPDGDDILNQNGRARLLRIYHGYLTCIVKRYCNSSKNSQAQNDRYLIEIEISSLSSTI